MSEPALKCENNEAIFNQNYYTLKCYFFKNGFFLLFLY